MKNIFLLFILLSIESTSQSENSGEETNTTQDKIMTITDGIKAVLEGYPDASLFDDAAINYCNNAINDAVIQTKNYLMALYINIVS